MARILVVDDEATVRSLIAGCLHVEGHQVTRAGSGVEAIQKLLEQPFDLLIIDLLMPGLSGYETVEQVRATERIATTPVILLSGEGEPYNFIRSAELAIAENVHKPVGFHELEDAVERVLNSEAALPEGAKSLKSEAVETYRQTIDLIREVRANTHTPA